MKLSFKTKSLIVAMGFVSVVLQSGTVGAVQSVDAGVPEYQKSQRYFR